MRYVDNVVELIGNTPLVRLHQVTKGTGGRPDIEALSLRVRTQSACRVPHGRYRLDE